MQDIFQALIKRSSIFIIVTGVMLLIIGASSDITIGSFSLMMTNPTIQWTIIVISIFLVVIGIFLEAKSTFSIRANKHNTENIEVSQAKVYKTRADSYIALLDITNNAKESIDTISFVSLKAADAKRNQFYDALRTAIEVRHTTHQRIVWNLDNLQWLEQMLNNGWDNLAEFSVKFYHTNTVKNPLTTFSLFDQTIIVLGQGWLVEGWVEIKGQDVGQFFRAYFAGIWNKSEWIKERGKPANKKRLKELIQELKKDE